MIFGAAAFAQTPFAAAAGNFFASSVEETATASVTDQTQSIAVFAPQVNETATATDATSSIFIFLVDVAESSTSTDTVSASTTLPASISEAASVADTTSSLPNYACAVPESVTATDTVITSASVIARIQENITATDTILRRLLWEQIDDDQTPSWTDITIPTTINDIATFGGMFFGDVSIAGQFNQSWIPDTEKWTQINDTQTPNWTEVVQ